MEKYVPLSMCLSTIHPPDRSAKQKRGSIRCVRLTCYSKSPSGWHPEPSKSVGPISPASYPSPASSFAARWVGKEAVFKSLGVKSKGAAAAMKEIEIINDASGVPTVQLHGEARSQAEAKGVKKVHISLSHSDTTAVAFAQATA